MCLVGTIAIETDDVLARAAKYNRRHERSHALAIQFKIRSETRCRASGLLAEQTRDSMLDLYAHVHTHTHTYAHIRTRTRVSVSSIANTNGWYLEFVNVKWA